MSTDPEAATRDREVRAYIYDQTMKTGWPPTLAETAVALSRPVSAIQAAFKRLAEGRVVVLQKDPEEILMANPFSAVPTPFLVQTRDRAYFGNCIWDALGIPAMLKQDAAIKASCGDCGTAVTLEIANGALLPAAGFAHFALPAMEWWADIAFT